MYADYLERNNLTDDEIFIQEDMVPTIMSAFGVEDDTHGISESMTEQYLPGVKLGNFDDMAPGLIDVSANIMNRKFLLKSFNRKLCFED